MKIPFLTQDDLILDNKKNLIPGAKIAVYDPVSNNPVDIYVYDGANERYTVTQNPVYLNGQSRPQHTYFADRLVLCRLYKYAGQLSDPMSDDQSENWKFVREWNGAFTQSEVKNDTVIFGIEALAEANTELKTVTVVGYWTDDDCEARTYVWNPTSVATPDGGYVIMSDTTDTGRWILEFDGEYLPSTYYGVYPGREANMNALLTFVDQIGDEKTAPGVYFKPGDYTDSTVAIVTNKKLLIDASSQFTRDSIQAADIKIVGSSDHCICDFITTNPKAEMHSSWFRSITGFLVCGAKKLILDETNHFFNTSLNHNYTLNQRIIEGTTRLPITYGDYRLILNNCQIVGQKIWNANDKITFQNTDFKDIWFQNPANIDFYNNILVRGTGVNTIRLENFTNVTAYVNAAGAWGMTVLDLAGREISGIGVPTSVVELRNVKANRISCLKGTSVDVTFRNVVCDDISLSARYITVYDSNINFSTEPSISAIWSYDSRVNSSFTWYSKGTQVEAENCYWGASLDRVTDNDHDTAIASFTNCTFQTNIYFRVKRITMKRCTTSNNSIKIYPIKIDNVYNLYGTFENCVFNNNTPIEFTKEEDDNCYECMLNWAFLGNTFAGNDEGIRMRFWQNRIGSNYTKMFVKPVQQNIKYQGNVGQCPDDTGRGLSIAVNDSGYSVVEITEDLKLYKYPSASKRVVCNRNTSTPSLIMNYQESAIGGSGTMFKYYSWVNSPYDSLTYDMFWQNFALYPYYIDDPINNGDWFRNAVVVTGTYIRIVQRGDGDHNRGVQARVI